MPDRDGGLIERLERSSSAIWLVQGNPVTSDVLAKVRQEGLPSAWCVKRHLREIRRGDRVLLWLSGARAGVYAAGEITRAPGPPTPDSVGIDLFVDLFDRPVSRASLKADPRCASESILRQPFAANPHRVSVPAFLAILERAATSLHHPVR